MSKQLKTRQRAICIHTDSIDFMTPEVQDVTGAAVEATLSMGMRVTRRCAFPTGAKKGATHAINLVLAVGFFSN